MYCSTQCIQADDGEADRERFSLAGLREHLEQQQAAIDADIAAYAAERRRHLRDIERDVAEAEAKVEPRLAALAQAKAAREVWWDLEVDRPVPDHAQRFA